MKIDPNYAPAYNLLGYAYAYLNNFDEAIANIKKYAFLCPDQSNPYDSLGEIYLNMGRYDEAITEFNRSRQMRSDFTFAAIHLGQAYRHKGMYKTAISYFKKILTQISVKRVESTACMKLPVPILKKVSMMNPWRSWKK